MDSKNTLKNDKEKIFSGVLWKLGERFLAQGISFVVSVLLARLLLPDEYGIVAIVLIFMAFADVFVVSGFSTSLIQKKDADETDFSTIFYCSLSVSILIYAVLFFTAPLIADFFEQPLLIPLLRVFSLRLPVGAYNSIQHAYVSRNMIFKRFFFSTLGGTLISGAAGIVMAYLGFGVWALVAQYLTNTVIDTIVLCFTVPWRPRLKFSIKRAKILMSYGWKVFLADFSGTFFDQLRSLIIGKFYVESQLAYYNRGKQFSSIIADNINGAVTTVLFPAISNRNSNKDIVKNMLSKSVRVTSYIVTPLLFGCAAIAEQLVKVLLTDKWLECVPFLQLLCLSSAIGLIGNVSLQAIKAVGRSDILLKLEIIKKPVYLLLLIIGVKISVVAVAVTMLIYSVYGTAVNACAIGKTISYPIKSQLADIAAPIFFSSATAGAVFALGTLPIPDLPLLILQICAGIGIYLGLSVIFKPFAFKYLKDFLMQKFFHGKG